MGELVEMLLWAWDVLGSKSPFEEEALERVSAGCPARVGVTGERRARVMNEKAAASAPAVNLRFV